MAFYMGLSNHYGGRYQSCNMDENSWYESIHPNYSSQHSIHIRNTIDISMTVPVSPAFSSHTVTDSESVYSHSSANIQRPVHTSTPESLYFPGRIHTPVPIDTSDVHTPVYTPSPTPIPITVHTPRPIYSSQQDKHSIFNLTKIHLSEINDSSFYDIGCEMEDSIVNKNKEYASCTPINYSMARPLDCSIAKKKEDQTKARKQRFLDETSEEREERLERIRKQALFRHLNETAEQRAHRLMVGRNRMRHLRDNEPEEDRAKRLQKGKEVQRQRRIKEKLTETKEEREARLNEISDRSRQRRAEETPEQRSERLRVTRDRLRLKQRNESPETRSRRLKTASEKKKIKYHQMSHEGREMMRIRERERAREYKRQTCGKELKE